MATKTPVWAVCMMRDEEDVAYYVVQQMIEEGVDGVIVADNMSTDGTKEQLHRAERYARENNVKMWIVDDDEPGYYQSQKMTDLANMAHSYGAEWIVPFDADEIWFAHADRLGVVLRDVDPSKNLVKVPLVNHFATILDDDTEENPFKRMGWRQAHPAPLHKVAFRWEDGCVVEQGNHSAGLPKGHRIDHMHDIELRHFPYRSFGHFCKKARNGAAAYAATDLPVDMGAHWRSYGKLLEERGEAEFRKVYEEFFWFATPTDKGLVYDPAPFSRW